MYNNFSFLGSQTQDSNNFFQFETEKDSDSEYLLVKPVLENYEQDNEDNLEIENYEDIEQDDNNLEQDDNNLQNEEDNTVIENYENTNEILDEEIVLDMNMIDETSETLPTQVPTLPALSQPPLQKATQVPTQVVTLPGLSQPPTQMATQVPTQVVTLPGLAQPTNQVATLPVLSQPKDIIGNVITGESLVVSKNESLIINQNVNTVLTNPPLTPKNKILSKNEITPLPFKKHHISYMRIILHILLISFVILMLYSHYFKH